MEEENKLKKDMGDDFTEKLSRMLTEIDILKQEMVSDRSAAFRINERLHALFIKLSGKLTDQELDEQYQIHERINSIHCCKNVRVDYFRSGQQYDLPLYRKYMGLLEEREIKLNRIMERLGLTNTEKREEITY